MKEAIEQNYKDFIHALRGIVENAGGQAAFCKIHGIGRANFNQILGFKGDMSLGTFNKICNAVGLPPININIDISNSKLYHVSVIEFLLISGQQTALNLMCLANK